MSLSRSIGQMSIKARKPTQPLSLSLSLSPLNYSCTEIKEKRERGCVVNLYSVGSEQEREREKVWVCLCRVKRESEWESEREREREVELKTIKLNWVLWQRLLLCCYFLCSLLLLLLHKHCLHGVDHPPPQPSCLVIFFTSDQPHGSFFDKGSWIMEGARGWSERVIWILSAIP